MERVNLFLYQVGEHEQLKNQEFPAGGTTSQPSTPPLSLTLQYLLTAYSEKREMENKADPAQRWLGDAMRVFHDYSVIAEDLPRHDGLKGQYEEIKISLDPISMEQMTEIWTAFTVPYRLSAAYSVSVVQIDSRRPKGTVRLVGQPTAAGPKVHSVPFQTPRIQEIRVERQDEPPPKNEWRYPYARIGDTLIVRGHNLSGDGETRVRIGEEEIAVSGENQQDTRLEIPLSDEEWLQPGSYAVAVQRGMAERPISGDAFSFTSNECIFGLVPRIDDVQPSSLPASGGTLTIQGKRLFEHGAENVTFVGRAQFGEGDFTTKTETQIEMDVSSLDPGEYPVRVRVAGMESILDDVTLTIEP